MTEQRDGYMEFRERLLDELKRLNTQAENLTKQDAEIRSELSEIKETLAALTVKSGVWGAVAGLIPAGIAVLWFILKGNKP